jgi:hypothetical protein
MCVCMRMCASTLIEKNLSPSISPSPTSSFH